MKTIFDFTLPRGFQDEQGQVHTCGQMKLATGNDEAQALCDPRVQANEAYLPIVLLSRVVVQLGSMDAVTPDIIASLFTSDLAYLQDLYLRLNGNGETIVSAICPDCGTQFSLRVAPLFE